ncbi:MAG: radical SAM protein [Spirochaetes bacterium]|nr:radical SAM protein [Spirochaetota bacterium]
MLKFCILDCYVDEPACFGVPPFISPYPRYLFGALVGAGVEPECIDYITIDHLREKNYLLDDVYAMVFLIGGAVVPGRYLGSKIGTLAEIRRITDRNSAQPFAIGGLISHIIRAGPGVTPVLNDIEEFAYRFARGEPADLQRSPAQIARWAVDGAAVVRRHPRFPHVICEIETSRGCPRESHCSFCSEGLFPRVEFRDAGDIISEIDSLIAAGVTRFRIGRQADILQYRSDCSSFKHGFPTPAIGPIRELLAELRGRIAGGLIRVLNIDNANPGTIARFPAESGMILEELVKTITPGDTMALGVESFDDLVVSRNNLKATAEESIRAVETVNRIGGTRAVSVPILLPGVNLLHGLPGESVRTFETNYRRLVEIGERGLLIKRINIRQVLPFPGTPLYRMTESFTRPVENRFRFYRDKIRSDVESPMLRTIYPVGTVLRDLQILETRMGYSYGKQISSYSITAKFPILLPDMSFHDAVVIGHRERSVIALPLPVNINALSQKSLSLIPGIGKKRATDIVLQRPFKTIDDAGELLKDVDGEIKKNIKIL